MFEIREEIKIFVECIIQSQWKSIVSKKKNTPNEKSSSRKIKQKRLMSLSNCAARGKKEQI